MKLSELHQQLLRLLLLPEFPQPRHKVASRKAPWSWNSLGLVRSWLRMPCLVKACGPPHPTGREGATDVETKLLTLCSCVANARFSDVGAAKLHEFHAALAAERRPPAAKAAELKEQRKPVHQSHGFELTSVAMTACDHVSGCHHGTQLGVVKTRQVLRQLTFQGLRHSNLRSLSRHFFVSAELAEFTHVHVSCTCRLGP